MDTHDSFCITPNNKDDFYEDLNNEQQNAPQNPLLTKKILYHPIPQIIVLE